MLEEGLQNVPEPVAVEAPDDPSIMGHRNNTRLL
jgi:hypothetical protein